MDGRKGNGAKKGENRGQGRKSIHDEIDSKELSIAAIEAVYGSKREGLEHCLRSEEPALIKFVFEHAFGKPTDKIQHSGDEDKPVLFLLDGRFKEGEGQSNS